MDDVRYGTLAGFAAAASEAHRRRTSTARAGILGIVLVVAMGGSSGLIGRSSSFDRIEPAVPTAEPSWAPEARPSPSPGIAIAGAPTGSGWAEGGTAPRSGPGTGPDAAPSPSGTPAGRGPGQRAGPQSTPATRTVHSYSLTCLNVGSDCTQATWTNKGGGRFQVTLSYCSTTDRVLRFGEDAEVEFRVTGWNRVLWTSLADYPPRPDAHELYVPGMTCLQWSSLWNGTFNDGRKLPKATYRLIATVRSPDAVNETASAVFTIK